MRLLAVTHGVDAPPGIFRDEVESRGHELDEWCMALREPPPRPVDDFAAVLLFGGAMHADEEDHHHWLREENLLIRRLLDAHVPVLGVCLGAQLIAKAAHAAIAPASEPEVGWFEVELTAEAGDDEVFSRLPERFTAFQWHFHEFSLPAGAVELARSAVCVQAFRLGDSAWGVQFHPEVTRGIVAGWLDDAPDELPVPAGELLAETDVRLDEWNELGRALCGGFLEAAERMAVAV